MNTRIFLLILLVSLPSLLRGQSAITISGQVTNKGGKGIPSAAIVLQQNGDTVALSKTVTDKDGFYTLKTSIHDNLILSAEATGYTPDLKTIAIARDWMVVNLDLVAIKSLSEVTVVSRKPVFEQKVDRTVFNVENSVTALGGDAMNALKKTPGVVIMNNQVTIAGKTSVGIMVNGRLQQLTGEDLAQLLHSIPTDNLARIEVITTPPARYDAEGNAGLINFVTKKNLKQGLKGSVTASYNQNSYAAPSISTSLNYRREKLNLFCNASTAIIGWKYTNRTTTYYPGQTWEQKLDMGSVTHTARLQLGADYNLTKSSVIGIVFSDNYNKLDNNDSLNQTSFSPGEVVDSVMHTTGHTGEEYKGKYAVNVNYEWRIDSNGKKLNVDLDYYTHDGRRSRDFYVHNYLDNGLLIGQSTNRMNGSPAIAIKSIKADVEFPTTPVVISFGVKASYVDNKVNNVYETLIGDQYEVDLSKTNAFSYIEKIQAVYVNAHKTVGKFELQLGLRAEHTRTEGYSATIDKTTIKDYTQLFPSGYIQYTPNEDHVLSIGYSRRINRPAYTYLNPFRFYYSPNSYAEGNPDLQPAIRNGIEFGYSIKSKYFIKAWAVQVDNYWDRIIETDTLTASTSVTRANLGRARFLGASLNVVCSPAKWWESRSGVSFEYSDFKLSHFGSTSNLSSVLYWLETDNSFFINKKKTWSAELNGYYYAPRQKDYKRWESMLCVNVGVRATFLDRNLIVGLNGDDIFGTAYWLQTNSANGTREYTYDDERSVRLSITYKFGNKNVKNKRERSLSTEEMQRANQQQ